MITKINFKDRTIKSYAIRKLTPKECFRLMGIRDGVILLMQASISLAKTRISSAFGKDAWAHIFGKAVKGNDNDMVISASQQYKQAGNSIVVDVLKSIYSQLWYPAPKQPQAQQASLFDDFFPDDVLPSMPVEKDPSDKANIQPGDKVAPEEKVIITTFSGYDSQLMAADALREDHPDFRWTCMGWSDIDKYACQMHNLVFPQYADRALGDITKIDWQKVKDSLQGREVDLFTYSSPCQDISQAGKQMGLKEGSDTRSALLWRVADAIEVLQPKYLLQENVAALVSEKFMPDFKKWLQKLESLGYVNRWARLNAKDYGVPQNRDRVFCLSMRRDVAFDYQFPEPIKLEKKLEDVLEEDVDERYFLKDDAVSKFLKANDKDSALFVQFDLPPKHEDAMFLKTWLSFWMEKVNGWDMKPTELDKVICEKMIVGKFTYDYSSWKQDGTEPSEYSGFRERYLENLNRKASEE